MPCKSTSHLHWVAQLIIPRFWKIAVPVMFVFIVVWTWNDIERLFHVMKKRAAERKYNMVSSARERIGQNYSS